MNVEEFREYCLSLPGVSEKMPFPNVADRYSRDVLCFLCGRQVVLLCQYRSVRLLLHQVPPGGINGAAGKVRGGEAGVAHEQEVLEQCVF